MRNKRGSIDFTRYALTAAAIGAATSAKADFSGPYSFNPPVNGAYTGANAIGTFGGWTSSLTYVPQNGNVLSSDGLTTNASTSVTLQLQNGDSRHTFDNFDLTKTIPSSGTISFSWNYTQMGFSSAAELFGYTLNGSFFQLAGPSSQSSSTNVPVTAGDVFGFRLAVNYAGGATVTISNFSAPVPEPAIAALILTGAVGLIALREARRRATKAA